MDKITLSDKGAALMVNDKDKLELAIRRMEDKR